MKILDKTNGKTIHESAAWGPLGTPTKEEIQKWCNMPAGEFANIVKSFKKCTRTKKKPLQEITVYVEKKLCDHYVCAVKVIAKDFTDATNQVMKIDKSEFEFESEPFKTESESFTYKSWNPSPKEDKSA